MKEDINFEDAMERIGKNSRRTREWKSKLR